MNIIFDRDALRLHTVNGDPLHSEALDTWREACALSDICIEALPASEVAETCQKLAETATHALTAGRDDRVIAAFGEVDQKIRDSEDALRKKVVCRALAICAICLALGFAIGAVWILVEPRAPWNSLPHGLDLAANYILLVLGWAGFTLVGFGIGWLFMVSGAVRFQDRAGVLKQVISLQQRTAYVAYNGLLSVIIVILMFFFGGFEKIDQELSQQLTSAPWAILLGLFAGIAEPVLFERIRGLFKLS